MGTSETGILGGCGRIRAGKDTAVNHYVDHYGAVRTGYGDMLARALEALCVPINRRHLQDFSTLVRLPDPTVMLHAPPDAHMPVLEEGGFGEILSEFLPGDAMLGRRLERALTTLHVDPTEVNLRRLEALVRIPSAQTRPFLALGGFGKDILAKGIFLETQELLKTRGRVVLSGVRRLADIELFRARAADFSLLYVHASIETRWRRAVADPAKPDEAGMTLEEFRSRDNAETEREIDAVAATAEYRIENESTKEAFIFRCDKLADEIGWSKD